MLPITPTLDFALSLVCLVLAWLAVRSSNDFLTAGFLWVAGAAFMGGLKFARVDGVDSTHSFLSDVAEGPGMLSVALGLLAAWYGPWPLSRWLAPVVTVVGTAGVHYLSATDSPSFASVLRALSLTLVACLILGGIRGLRAGRWSQSLSSFGALAALLTVAFGLNAISIPAEYPLQRVDLVHILLAIAYVFVWLSAR